MALPAPELPSGSLLQLAVGYPDRLRRLGHPPAEIWFRGALPPERDSSIAGTVAIVGSRAASAAGRARAHRLAAELGAAGFVVISGGAFGIDAAAHEGALDAGAPTFAVLGCGLDIVYPDRHGPLYDRIARAGGLLSEYPPGTQPRPGQFPARNRLIAALAQVVIVVEAARRSGALSTAAHAVALGVPLLASGGSPGTDGLLRSGQAQPEAGLASVRAALRGETAAAPARVIPQDAPFAAVLAALRAAPDSAAGLVARLGLRIEVVLGQLSEAELDGWVRRAPGGVYEVIGGH